MIIKNTIDNEPILSNVGQVGEFRIRNSAKAFSILSSGLYANKIRAIIREYSCNAIDSHTEAGNLATPFDVHLPNSLEPWFAVRDYGVGLDEQQVRNIFTTYFESTKTATDELIGGLGLGSKSAFSFTDNFTIVAVKNGVKRVYTAFINEQGVPSIAPMGEEGSNEPNGVEIRFAVEDSWDFRKFHDEARHVYKHFKHRPVISGGFGEFKFIDPVYEDRDIIPGVHSNDGHGRSVAIMGNIEYPLDVPANADLGGLEHLLTCNLTIEFAIGELDIQASREGLSYIPETIAAIKTKLEAINAVLTVRLAEQVDVIKNQWEKAFFLNKKMNSSLWHTAVRKYIADASFNLLSADRYGTLKASRYSTLKEFQFTEEELEKRFNIKITAFRMKGYYGGDRIASTLGPKQFYDNNTGNYVHKWAIHVADTTEFVENDTTVGVGNRAKYHWKNADKEHANDCVYILNRADKKKDMKIKSFFKALSNPPKEQIRKASVLMQQERAKGIAKGVTVLKLEKRDYHGHMRSDDMVWRPAGDMSSFNDNETYYYLPLSGFTALGVVGEKGYDMKTFAQALKNSGVFTETVYGVRKTDLENIKGKTNWVNLDDYLRAELAKPGIINVKGIIKEAIDYNAYFKFAYVQNDITNANSPYLKLFNEFAGATAVNKTVLDGFQRLCIIYDIKAGNVNVTDEVAKYKKEMNAVEARYPLLNSLDQYFRDSQAVAEYINAIDMLKGI